MTSVARSSGDISCKAMEVNVTYWGSDYVSFDIYRLFFFFFFRERGIVWASGMSTDRLSSGRFMSQYFFLGEMSA
jgi:hypothetical protein